MRSLFLILSVMVLFFVGCDTADINEPEVAKVQLRLELEGLPPLQEGFAYQAWVQMGFETLPTERFNVTESGSFVNGAGQFIQNVLLFDVDISDATSVFVTIENKSDSDETPSNSVVLAGDLSEFVAPLSRSHTEALGSSYDDESGTFMLLSWVGGASSDDTSGLWFINGTRTAPTAGLSLPALPDGWVYEGWMDIAGTSISTGTFRESDTFDLKRLYSQSDTPPFPGEDFAINAPSGVTFPLDPSGGTVRVSVEPFPDDTIEPYGIFVLSGSVPSNPAAETAYPLSASNAGPTGTATIF